MDISTQTIEDLSLIAPTDASTLGTINWTWLVSSTVIILVLSHIGAKYLASVSPRGYWFWFTILNIAISLFFL